MVHAMYIADVFDEKALEPNISNIKQWKKKKSIKPAVLVKLHWAESIS